MITFMIILNVVLLSAKTHYVTAIDSFESLTISSGDSVLFKRGDIFRGQLIPVSGTDGFNTVYGAFGMGNKPKIFGSLQKSNLADWVNETGNIWKVANNIVPIDSEILLNPDFNENLFSWSEWHNIVNGASITLSRTTVAGEYYSFPGGGKVSCVNNGINVSDIQFWTSNYIVKNSKWYRLTLKAKASKPFTLNSSNISIFKNGSPYTVYATAVPKNIEVSNSWKSIEVLLKTNTASENDARINIMLGGIIPDSSDFYFDSLSLRELSGDPALVINDVGNLIFDNEALCGVKVKNESDLNSQGKFWYDKNNHTVKMYSANNPSVYYSSIEMALTKDIISQGAKSFITYENLDLRYGAAHGIGGGSTHHITIKDVDVSYIGGGYLPGFGDGFVRYGNGVEFWNGAHDNIVERCTFNQIYDAAVTAQGIDSNGYETYNIIFRNNIITNSEFSYELWARGPASYMHHVYFENNTCLNAGFGWGHSQRPDPNGTHLIFWGFTAQSNDVYVRNNIFSESSDYGSRWLNMFELDKVIIDNNCWYESEGLIAMVINTGYDFATQWDGYKSVSRKDSLSIAANPMLNSDYTLKSNSPCIDSGYSSSVVKTDFYGYSRPQGRKYDIGAVEFREQSSFEIDSTCSDERLSVYPNPFNPSTVISFFTRSNIIKFEIFTIDGRFVKSFDLGNSNGSFSVIWNGDDSFGRKVASGVYLVQMENSKTILKKRLFVFR